MKKNNSNETKRQRHRVARASAEFFTCRLLYRTCVNVEISSSTDKCQLYQIKELEDKIQTNSAAKEICHNMAKFWRENGCGRTRFPTFFPIFTLTFIFFL